jgi:hypothetical protein
LEKVVDFLLLLGPTKIPAPWFEIKEGNKGKHKLYLKSIYHHSPG